MKQKQKNIPNNKILSKKINTKKSRVTQHKNRAISSENRSNKRNKSKQKIKIEEEKNFKENQESIKRYRTNINYSMNLVNEKKKNFYRI